MKWHQICLFQILALNDGHIVQRGTHDQLIREKGLYAHFVSARQEAIGWKLNVFMYL